MEQFNIQPQFYRFQPVDEVIRQRRAGEAPTSYATGFNPWLLTPWGIDILNP